MNKGYHRMPPDLFAAMAAGGGGPAATSILAAAQRSKHALLLRGTVTRSAATGHAEAALAERGYDLLGSAQRHAPGTVAALIRHPSVGAWAYRTVLALSGGPAMKGATPSGLAAVAAAAAVRAGMPAEIEVPLIDGLVMLPSLGAATISAHGQDSLATVCVTPGGAEVTTRGSRVVIPADHRTPSTGWRPLLPLLTAPFELLADDMDPFRMPAAPHLAQPADMNYWSRVFQQAWTLLERHHPDIAAEVAALITVVVPLARPAEGQVSSSSPETFGAIALSEPTDACTLACTLAHEVQHVKLSALLDLVRLTRNDDGRRFYAPWRQDPRPANGLLQGAYAYLGVTDFWRRQRQLDTGMSGHVQFARWRAAAVTGTRALLSSGLLTPAGQRFARGMAATLDAWQDEPVPGPARQRAAEKNARHLARWESAHGSAALSAS
jgi:HEXXH motif-containing protein